MADVVELLRTTVGASDIKRVAIVDDVFDTPSIDPDDTGAFLEFLQSSEEVRAHAQIEQLVWAEAITDIGQGEHDSGNVAEVLEKLYEKYIDTGDVKCDPAGVFARKRDANLGFLRPLLELLRSCESLVIQTFGSATPTIGEEEMPDLVLVDLFLNPAISPVDEPNHGDALAAAEKSMERVRPLLTKDPAIILMSSHGEKGQQEADSYRAKLNDHVYASRFAFVEKGQVTKHPDNGLRIEGAARDTLLDVFQTYKFGKALSECMTRWLEAATNATGAMGKDVRSLQLKEIAYLVQFRLATEGQGLEEYLEWFFGEALLDYIIRATDDAHAKKPLELALDPVSVSAIDGGFEPTKSVATMYHRVRVESKRSRPRKNFRLGDLYRDNKKNRVVAVMTPDCDLVLRKSKNKEIRNAEHLLLVPGLISDLEKASASVGDFLMIGEVPHNIQWVYKKVFSLPFSGTLEKAGQSGDDFEYLGALRPLYAQEIQANLINHIGRVGVAVPPVIGLPAVSTIAVRTTTGVKEISAQGTTFNCSLIPGRSSTHQPRVLFDRDVIRKIKAALLNMPADDLIAGSTDKIEVLKQDNAVSVEKALKQGPEIGTELANGIMLATGKRDGTVNGPWCAIYVSQVKVQAEPKDQQAHQAPAVPAVEIALAPVMQAVGLVEPETAVTAEAVSPASLVSVDPTTPQPDAGIGNGAV
jgi:hypothetical protein